MTSHSSIDSPLAVIRSVLKSLRGVRIADVGCGSGGLAKELVTEGAKVTGIDPNEAALAKARQLVPEAVFLPGSADALPFPNRSFDALVMMNALHHVPAAAMAVALREAARVVPASGAIVIIEPLAEGSFFEALRCIEDETDVRHAAQQALAQAVRDNVLHPRWNTIYVRREVYDSTEEFLARVIAVDPNRETIIADRKSEVIAAILDAAETSGDGNLVFNQPIKADVFSPSVAGQG